MTPAQREDLVARLAVAADMLAIDSLSSYVRLAWKLINPGRPLVWNWHMEAMCSHLEAVTKGKIRHLAINVPPGHSKTTIVTICWPTWEWLKAPELRYLCASYADSLSAKAADDRRAIIKSAWYKTLQSHCARAYGVPEWTLESDSQHRLKTSRGGEMIATSVGGLATGRHADRNIVDDPIKAEDIYTVELTNHVRWFQETLTSRVTSVKTSAFVIVMQRLHAADLSGVLLDDPDWCFLKLPAEYEPAKAKPNKLGWVDPRTQPGEPLFPERFPKEYLEKRKGPFGIGPIAFSAQEQQDPIAGSGNIFQREWWKFWWSDHDKPADPLDRLPDDVDRVIGSWDMTFKGGVGADFVVGQIWAIKGASMYLLDQTRARLSFNETESAFINMRRKWPMVTRWLVEEKANGAAIIDRLKTQIPGIIPVIPTESKEARAAAVASFVQAGNIWLPTPATHPWVLQLIEEAAAFPRGTFDDQVDALSQALRDVSLAKKITPFTLPEPIAPRRPPSSNPAVEAIRQQVPAITEIGRRLRDSKRTRIEPYKPGLPSATWDPKKT